VLRHVVAQDTDLSACGNSYERISILETAENLVGMFTSFCLIIYKILSLTGNECGQGKRVSFFPTPCIRNVSLRQIFIELVRNGMKACTLAFDMLTGLKANWKCADKLQ
jgi:hypothetical protein